MSLETDVKKIVTEKLSGTVHELTGNPDATAKIVEHITLFIVRDVIPSTAISVIQMIDRRMHEGFESVAREVYESTAPPKPPEVATSIQLPLVDGRGLYL